MLADVSLWGLFLSAFVSSTLFPGGSEVVLGVLAAERHYDPWLLLAIASFGKHPRGTHHLAARLLLARRFPLEDHLSKHRQRALAWLRRWGSPALLLSWLPVVGDPLCFAAGFLRLAVPGLAGIHRARQSRALRGNPARVRLTHLAGRNLIA